MELLDNILKWTETNLTSWQQDAVRRLFQQENGLSEHDHRELYMLLKADHGLPNLSNLIPLPLKAAHLPVVSKADETVILTAMRNLTHVNRISQNQILEFAPSGMTLIYGDNGSGKSGYTRVMKRACRARDQAEKVHPDANDPTVQHCVPEATFDIKINGVPKPINWTSNSDPPDELATIAVFDYHCAQVYLTSEQEVAYLPYGLDVVENLANKVLPTLSNYLDNEISEINTDDTLFKPLLGETEVGRLISSLDHTTDPAKVKKLGTLSEKEIERVEILEKALNETKPTEKANALRLSADRITNLAKRIEDIFNIVNDSAIKKLKSYYDSSDAANQAEKQAAEVLQAGEKLLPGTGEPIWKELFNAARKYSTEVAYQGHPFPHTDEKAVCPLCQQPFKDSGERIRRFEEYIQNDVAKTVAQKRQEVEFAMTEIERADLSARFDEPLIKELDDLDDVIVPIIRTFQERVEVRRTWMLESLKTHPFDTAPTFGENPLQRLRDLATRLLKSALTLESLADETRVKSLKFELEELRSRKHLSEYLSSVLSLIERMKQKQLLESCKKDLKTKSISEKSKEFSKDAVTVALKTALDAEFKSLGIGYIKTLLKDRNEKGKIKHRIILDLPSTLKIEEILSEGEQRAIALGAFLAELKLANHNGGIVLDDPVSSLDHKHRGDVAKRLANESKQRQVIVFTHDIVFLQQLRDECDKLNFPPLISNLQKVEHYYGNVFEGLPWAHQNYGERIDSLEKAQKKLEKIPWPTDPNEEQALKIKNQYDFFRATIERVVEQLVLNRTVQRFKDYINVNLLKKVVGLEQTEVDEILRLYQRSNDWVNAHDPSSFKNAPPPTPDDLKQDIENLKNLIQKIKERQKKIVG